VGPEQLSLEAHSAVAAYDDVAGDLTTALLDCASGRELVDRGFADDVRVAAVGGVSQGVPVLVDGRFVAAP
jgi:2-phosphosulfolactate phosphatase